MRQRLCALFVRVVVNCLYQVHQNAAIVAAARNDNDDSTASADSTNDCYAIARVLGVGVQCAALVMDRPLYRYGFTPTH